MGLFDSMDEQAGGNNTRRVGKAGRTAMTIRVAISPKRFALSTVVALVAVVWLISAYVGTLQAAPTESAPVPAAQIPQPINDAINAPDRPAADKALEAGRKPDQIMAFYEIKPGMKVDDIFAGGGYMTELIARVVGPTGKVYSQNGPFPEKYKKVEDAWHERLKEP